MRIKSAVPILLIIIVYVPLVIIKSVWESSLPGDLSSTDLPLVKNRVYVSKDRFGIPHIKASDKIEMYHTLGFMIASDRLFQMDIHRRVASGRLSEIFGVKMLEADKVFRTFRFRSAMKRLIKINGAKMDQEMFKYLDAFYAGINHYIDTKPLPIEFRLLGYRPDHFDKIDGMAFIGYMGYSFASSFKYDILFQELSSKLSEKMLNELKIFPEQVVGKKRAQFNPVDLKAWNKILTTTENVLSRFGNIHGSNSWVLSGKRTRSGFPILANDPHIAVSHPGTWYEAHIETGDYKMYGHFLPLLPFPILGHSDRYGWALTMSKVDEINIYREKVDRDKGVVKFKGKWVPLIKEREVIKVKDAVDVVLDILLTPHGPLITSMLDQSKIKDELSLRWVYFDDDNFSLESLYKMGIANSMKEFEDALALGAAPGLNISYADREGNIGWWVYGKIPIMPKGVLSDRFLDGSSGKEEYQGYLPFSKNPSIINPSSGVIVSANYLPTGFGNKWQGLWEPSDRFDTITKLLSIKKKWDLFDLQKVQTKSIDIKFLDIMTILTSKLDSNRSKLSTKELEVYDIFKHWDFESGSDSYLATIFHLWNHVNVRLLMDELPKEGLKKYCSLTTYWFFYERALKDMNSYWWDRLVTKKRETGGDIILAGWRQTINTLQRKFGPDISKWTWGKLHTIEYEHPLGKVKPLNLVFNLGPYPVSGGFNQINNMRAKGCSNEFKVTSFPSTRRLIDFAFPEISMGILPTGQSEHVLSPNYSDQSKMFLNGEYRAQLMDWNMIIDDSVVNIIFY